ncbi:hypothetical protein ACGTN6_04420 [Halomonas sp. THAF12]|uniref:hypothetical protein n=1 Tax=Halomonas sp. B23F22_10 TaxID=3459515 RepID=UPI00373F6FDB
MIEGDQAAGLRAWAASIERSAPETAAEPMPAAESPATLARAEVAAGPLTTLMVVGLPGSTPGQADRVMALLDHWAGQGRRWVGDPRRWKVVPLAASSPHLSLLAQQQPRWALWVGADGEAFRRAFAVLGRLAADGGPRRLLAVHPPGMPRQGLLDNLRQAARHYFGIDLLVMA